MFFLLLLQDPISALSWGHNDYKLFVAASNQLYSVSVDKEIPSLQSICQRAITAALQHKDKSYDLVLPTRMKVGLAQSFTSIIKVNNCYTMLAFNKSGHVGKQNPVLYNPTMLYLVIIKLCVCVSMDPVSQWEL